MGTYCMYETQMSQRQVVYPAFSTTFSLLLFFFFVYIYRFFLDVVEVGIVPTAHFRQGWENRVWSVYHIVGREFDR